MAPISETEVAMRLVAALLAGGILGWERESHRKPAGLRTHMLVALGAAAFILAALRLHQDLVVAGQASATDLLKVIAGIVGGVGFLGAGSIMRAGGEVRGLTTAATIWLAASIGLACGLGYYLLAAACVLLALAVLLALGLIEQRWHFPFSRTTEPSESDGPNPETTPYEPE
jgi:putative Mg2+ transporter-C (MgtC) family protein